MQLCSVQACAVALSAVAALSLLWLVFAVEESLASRATARKQTAPLGDGLLSSGVGFTTAVGNPLAPGVDDTRPSSQHGHNAESEFEAPPLASSMAEAANAEPAGPPPRLVAAPDEPATSTGTTVTASI